MSQPIPGPPGLPLLGNINDLDPTDGLASLIRLADTYGILSSAHLHFLPS
jgi:cytochrome P450/NADPH-cytochrome P450 reductase